MDVPTSLLREVANIMLLEGRDCAVESVPANERARALAYKFVHIAATMCRTWLVMNHRIEAARKDAGESPLEAPPIDDVIASLTTPNFDVPAFVKVVAAFRRACVAYATRIIKYAVVIPTTAAEARKFMAPVFRTHSELTRAAWRDLVQSFAQVCCAPGSMPPPKVDFLAGELCALAHPVILDFLRMHFELSEPTSNAPAPASGGGGGGVGMATEPVAARLATPVEKGMSIAVILQYLNYVLPAARETDTALPITRITPVEVEFLCGRFSDFGIVANRLVETAMPQYTAVDAWNERARCIEAESNFPYVMADIFSRIETAQGVVGFADLVETSVYSWSPSCVWIRTMLTAVEANRFACSSIGAGASMAESKKLFLAECARQLGEARARVAHARRSVMSLKPVARKVTFDPARLEIEPAALHATADHHDDDEQLTDEDTPEDDADVIAMYDVSSSQSDRAGPRKNAPRQQGRRAGTDADDDDDDEEGSDTASIVDYGNFFDLDEDTEDTDALAETGPSAELMLIAQHMDKCSNFVMQFLRIVDDASFQHAFAKSDASRQTVPQSVWGADRELVPLWMKVDTFAARLNATCALDCLPVIRDSIATNARLPRCPVAGLQDLCWIKFANATSVADQRARTWFELYEFSSARSVRGLAGKWARRVEALVLGIESIAARLICNIIVVCPSSADNRNAPAAADTAAWDQVRAMRMDAQLKTLIDRAQLALTRFALLLYATRSNSRNRGMSRHLGK